MTLMILTQGFALHSVSVTQRQAACVWSMPTGWAGKGQVGAGLGDLRQT